MTTIMLPRRQAHDEAARDLGAAEAAAAAATSEAAENFVRNQLGSSRVEADAAAWEAQAKLLAEKKARQEALEKQAA